MNKALKDYKCKYIGLKPFHERHLKKVFFNFATVEVLKILMGSPFLKRQSACKILQQLFGEAMVKK